MPQSPCPILQCFGKFRAAFTQRSFAVAIKLFVGIVLAGGSHTLAACIRILGCLGVEGHFSRFYRFFSAYRWFPEQLTRLLTSCVLELLGDAPLVIAIDDTLVEHRGPQIWGIGMHYDTVRSTYGRRGRRRSSHTACGHNWVIASLLVALPWRRAAFRALPVAARLYRNAKHAGAHYRKRTELAAELIEQICRWVPPHHRVYVVGDATYTCRTVARALPNRVPLVGPLPRDAALHDQPVRACRRGRGRPRKYGRRLPSPAEMFDAPTTQWRKRTVCMYGRRVTVRLTDFVAQWPALFKERPVRVVLTYPTRGAYRPAAYVCDDTDLSAEQIVELYARRWAAEVMHREVKQNLGAGAIQNGWYRRARRASQPLDRPPGPRPHPQRGRRAVERTFPFLLFIYSVIHLWYFQANRSALDVATRRTEAPWYRHKHTPSFADMLCAARSELLASFLADPTAPGFQEKLHRLVRAIAAPS